MAKAMSGEEAVPLEEVVLAQAFELEALMNVLERRGLITKTAVLGACRSNHLDADVTA